VQVEALVSEGQGKRREDGGDDVGNDAGLLRVLDGDCHGVNAGVVEACRDAK